MRHMNQLLFNYHTLIASGNRFAAAGANALLILIIIILLGLCVKLLTTAIVQIGALIFGAGPAILFCNYITYPGVVHHELAHAFLAFITGAHVDRITLRPRGTTLGSVDFTPRGNTVRQALEMTLSAIAPVICGLITLTLMRHFLYPMCALWWQFLIFYYFFVSILLHMDLSPQDIGVAAKGIPLFLVVCFVIFCVWRVDVLTLLSRVLPLIFGG